MNTFFPTARAKAQAHSFKRFMRKPKDIHAKAMIRADQQMQIFEEHYGTRPMAGEPMDGWDHADRVEYVRLANERSHHSRLGAAVLKRKRDKRKRYKEKNSVKRMTAKQVNHYKKKKGTVHT